MTGIIHFSCFISDLDYSVLPKIDLGFFQLILAALEFTDLYILTKLSLSCINA